MPILGAGNIMCKCEKVDKIDQISDVIIECLKIMNDFEDRMLKIEADIISINRWIEKNETTND